MTGADEGLARAIVLREERRAVVEAARRVGVSPVFLKGAWADPVLYGGRGKRLGGDIDILVAEEDFSAVSRELLRRGYRALTPPGFRATHAAARAWVFTSPTGPWQIDLHRMLLRPDFFALRGAELLARAHTYESVDGPILSLAPEDQIVYAAGHRAHHLFASDMRQAEDCRRLIDAFAIDWRQVGERAHRAHLFFALQWFAEELATAGANLPAELQRLDTNAHRRQRLVCRLRDKAPAGGVGRTLYRLAALAVLAGRPMALPRFFMRWGWLRLNDRR